MWCWVLCVGGVGVFWTLRFSLAPDPPPPPADLPCGHPLRIPLRTPLPCRPSPCGPPLWTPLVDPPCGPPAPDPPCAGPPHASPPKISLFFFLFPLPPHFRSFCLSLWVSSRGILVVFSSALALFFLFLFFFFPSPSSLLPKVGPHDLREPNGHFG